MKVAGLLIKHFQKNIFQERQRKVKYSKQLKFKHFFLFSLGCNFKLTENSISSGQLEDLENLNERKRFSLKLKIQ